MRLKHNKKRNTAFLFEVVTREYVRSVVKNNLARQKVVKNIIIEHFCSGPLKDELLIYKELLESSTTTEEDARDLLSEAKLRYQDLNKKKIFARQNRLIKEINHSLAPSVFSNFVPNYKDIATVYNIFNNKTSIKEKMLLEQKFVDKMTHQTQENKQHIDNLTYKTFVNNFNKKYSNLPEDQRNLLTTYIVSFSDNGLELKNHLNEKVSELKSRIDALQTNEVFAESEMQEKLQEVCLKLESYKNQEINDTMVSEVLMMQELVRELDNA